MDSDPLKQMSDEERRVALERALAKLPEEQREVFELRRAGLSFKEIAEIQHCSINTALSRMNYLKKTLREEIEI